MLGGYLKQIEFFKLSYFILYTTNNKQILWIAVTQLLCNIEKLLGWVHNSMSNRDML